MNILLLGDGELELPASDRRARHVRRILKLGTGDSLRAGIIDGPLGVATIEKMNRDSIVFSFVADDSERPPSNSRWHVSLLLGHPRPIVLRRMFRDLCTIGVTRIVVVPTELGEKSYYRAGMWTDIRPYLVEGAEQAGDTRLTRVVRADSLQDGLAALNGSATLRVVLHPGSHRSLTELAKEHSERWGVTLAIGSERGWTESELGMLVQEGFLPAGLGDRILRTETAALVSCWLAGSLQ